MYCAVERNDCSVIKLLNNESGEPYGFVVHDNQDGSSGTMHVL